MTLDNLPLETEAVITTVGGEGALRCRFLDMGLIPKTKVVVKKIAPMGDPIEIRLRNYELTIRKKMQKRLRCLWRKQKNDICISRQSELR